MAEGQNSKVTARLFTHIRICQAHLRAFCRRIYPSKAEFFVLLIANCVLFIKYYKRLFEYRDIILMTEGGYGHTILDPDLARRVLPSGFTFVIFSSVKRHNWKTAEMWSGCNVLHFWLFLFVRDLSQIQRMTTVVVFILRKVFQRNVRLMREDPSLIGSRAYQMLAESTFLIESYRAIAAIRWRSKVSSNEHLSYYLSPNASHQWVSQSLLYSYQTSLYWSLDAFFEKSSSPLPPRFVELEFRYRLKKIRPMCVRYLTIYARDKGHDIRCGGELQEYRVLIEMGLERGFAILLVGDRSRQSAPVDLKAQLVDYRSLGMSKEWFENCALTLCDYFIGDAGGGTTLPALCDMPKLMVNCAPYSQGVPGFLHLYKRVVDEHGNLTRLIECFSGQLFTYDPGPGYVWRNNTLAELREAAQELFTISRDDWYSFIDSSSVKGLPRFESNGFRLCRIQAAEVTTYEEPNEL